MNNENESISGMKALGNFIGSIKQIQSDFSNGIEEAKGMFNKYGVRITNDGRHVSFNEVQKTYKLNEWGYKIFSKCAKNSGKVESLKIGIKPIDVSKVLYDVNHFWKKKTEHKLLCKNGQYIEIAPTYSKKS